MNDASLYKMIIDILMNSDADLLIWCSDGYVRSIYGSSAESKLQARLGVTCHAAPRDSDEGGRILDMLVNEQPYVDFVAKVDDMFLIKIGLEWGGRRYKSILFSSIYAVWSTSNHLKADHWRWLVHIFPPCSNEPLAIAIWTVDIL